MFHASLLASGNLGHFLPSLCHPIVFLLCMSFSMLKFPPFVRTPVIVYVLRSPQWPHLNLFIFKFPSSKNGHTHWELELHHLLGKTQFNPFSVFSPLEHQWHGWWHALCSTHLWGLVHFSSIFFFLFCRFGDLYWFILDFTLLFSCFHLKSALELSSDIFNFRYHDFQL